MDKNTIVFISWVPLTSTTADQINMPALKEAGYRIIYLNLARYYFPENWHKYCSSNKEYIVNAEYIYDCKDEKEILDWIKRESGRAWFWVLHCYTYFEPKDAWLFRKLKKYNCDYFFVNDAPVFLPTDFASTSRGQLSIHIINRCLGLLRKFRFKEIFQKISHWLICYLIYHGIFLQTPKYFFVAGEIFEKKIKLLFPKTKVIKIPSYDYVRAVKVINSRNFDKLISLKPYIVYLDQGIFDTPDSKLLGYSTIDRDIFFTKINNFFNKLESLMGKQIIIAAPPKQKYKGDEYNNRKIVYGLTPEAVYHSDMAIAHTTTAVNFAIIMKKPLLLLSLDEFSEPIKTSLNDFAFVFKRPFLRTEEQFDKKTIEKLSAVDNGVYENYCKNYIYSPGAPLSTAETIIKKLKIAE